MNFILLATRFLFLSVFFLIGTFSMFAAVLAIVRPNTQNDLVFGTIVGSICYLIFYFIKKSKFLVLSENQRKKLDAVSSEVASRVASTTKDWIEKGEQEIDFNRKKKVFVDSVKRAVEHEPVDVVILGGAGWESHKGENFLLSLDKTNIYMSDLKELKNITIRIDKIMDIDISGPGKVTSDAGIIGGGFGFEGALKGIAIATVVNLLTTHSNTKTFIRLGQRDSEIVMLTSKIEPDQARLLLSAIFVKTKNIAIDVKSDGISDELTRLHELKEKGVITESEFVKAKQKLIG